MDLYAKIYLYSTVPKNQVSDMVVQLTGDLKSLDWSVIKNDDFDQEKSIQFPDGFLFFPYMIELDSVESFGEEIYIESIAILLSRLWGKGMPAVISADFEDKLPEKGGYKSRNIPFPIA